MNSNTNVYSFASSEQEIFIQWIIWDPMLSFSGNLLYLEIVFVFHKPVSRGENYVIISLMLMWKFICIDVQEYRRGEKLPFLREDRLA